MMLDPADMPDEALAEMAIGIIRHQRHAIRVRSVGLAIGDVGDPHNVVDLIAWLRWHGKMNVIDALEHGLTLNGILHHCQNEMAELATSSRPDMDVVKVIYEQATAASAMLALLGDRYGVGDD